MGAGLRLDLLVAVVAAGLLPAAVAAQTGSPLTADDGARLIPKLAEITAPAPTDGSRPGPVVLHEREVNGYLQFQAASTLPSGVTDPSLSLGDDGHVAAGASVDLSALSASQPRGALDPLRYLSGVVPVAASGVLKTEHGQGLLEIDAVTVGGIPVPLSVLHELVRHYSRSESDPAGVDLSKPFVLPYRVVDVLVTSGQALIVR